MRKADSLPDAQKNEAQLWLTVFEKMSQGLRYIFDTREYAQQTLLIPVDIAGGTFNALPTVMRDPSYEFNRVNELNVVICRNTNAPHHILAPSGDPFDGGLDLVELKTPAEQQRVAALYRQGGFPCPAPLHYEPIFTSQNPVSSSIRSTGVHLLEIMGVKKFLRTISWMKTLGNVGLDAIAHFFVDYNHAHGTTAEKITSGMVSAAFSRYVEPVFHVPHSVYEIGHHSLIKQLGDGIVEFTLQGMLHQANHGLQDAVRHLDVSSFVPPAHAQSFNPYVPNTFELVSFTNHTNFSNAVQMPFEESAFYKDLKTETTPSENTISAETPFSELAESSASQALEKPSTPKNTVVVEEIPQTPQPYESVPSHSHEPSHAVKQEPIQVAPFVKISPGHMMAGLAVKNLIPQCQLVFGVEASNAVVSDILNNTLFGKTYRDQEVIVGEKKFFYKMKSSAFSHEVEMTVGCIDDKGKPYDRSGKGGSFKLAALRFNAEENNPIIEQAIREHFQPHIQAYVAHSVAAFLNDFNGALSNGNISEANRLHEEFFKKFSQSQFHDVNRQTRGMISLAQENKNAITHAENLIAQNDRDQLQRELEAAAQKQIAPPKALTLPCFNFSALRSKDRKRCAGDVSGESALQKGLDGINSLIANRADDGEVSAAIKGVRGHIKTVDKSWSLRKESEAARKQLEAARKQLEKLDNALAEVPEKYPHYLNDIAANQTRQAVLQEALKILDAHEELPIESNDHELPVKSEEKPKQPIRIAVGEKYRVDTKTKEDLEISRFRTQTAQLVVDAAYWVLNRLKVEKQFECTLAGARVSISLEQYQNGLKLTHGVVGAALQLSAHHYDAQINALESASFLNGALNAVRYPFLGLQLGRAVINAFDLTQFPRAQHTVKVIDNYVLPITQLTLSIGFMCSAAQNFVVGALSFSPEVLLKIPEAHEFFLEPDPQDNYAYKRFFIGNMLLQLHTNKNGYELCFMSDFNGHLIPGKIYINQKDGKLTYSMVASDGKSVKNIETDIPSPASFKPKDLALLKKEDSILLKDLIPLKDLILEATSKKGHTKNLKEIALLNGVTQASGYVAGFSDTLSTWAERGLSCVLSSENAALFSNATGKFFPAIKLIFLLFKSAEIALAAYQTRQSIGNRWKEYCAEWEELQRNEQKSKISMLFLKHMTEKTLENAPTPGDGNCLFHAIAHYVENSALELRKMALDYERTHREEFDVTLIEGNFDAHLQKMAQGAVVHDKATWGTTAEIYSLAKILNRPIIVIWPKLKNLDHSHKVMFELPGNPIFIHLQDGHYTALLPRGEPYFEIDYEKSLAAQRTRLPVNAAAINFQDLSDAQQQNMRTLNSIAEVTAACRVKLADNNHHIQECKQLVSAIDAKLTLFSTKAQQPTVRQIYGMHFVENSGLTPYEEIEFARFVANMN